MKAVILAAGVGSRLNEITKSIPKSMIKINNKYIFKIIVDALVVAGIKDIVFIIGYRHKILKAKIVKEFSDYDLNIEFVINKDYSTTNTMYSLWLAKERLTGPFISLHGDLIFDDKILLDFINSNKGNSVLVDKSFPLDWDDAMKIIAHKNELKYMSKQITLNEMDGVAIGIYQFDELGAQKLFNIISNLISKGVVSSWLSEAINILAKEITVNVFNIDNDNQWTDIDNLTDLEQGIRISKEILSN